MIAIQPANAEWRMEQGNANANLGIVLLTGAGSPRLPAISRSPSGPSDSAAAEPANRPISVAR